MIEINQKLMSILKLLEVKTYVRKGKEGKRKIVIIVGMWFFASKYKIIIIRRKAAFFKL